MACLEVRGRRAALSGEIESPVSGLAHYMVIANDRRKLDGQRRDRLTTWLSSAPFDCAVDGFGDLADDMRKIRQRRCRCRRRRRDEGGRGEVPGRAAGANGPRSALARVRTEHGLDVDHRGPVDRLERVDADPQALDRLDPRPVEPDRVRAVRRAGGEQALGGGCGHLAGGPGGLRGRPREAR